MLCIRMKKKQKQRQRLGRRQGGIHEGIVGHTAKFCKQTDLHGRAMEVVVSKGVFFSAGGGDH